jgi:uncharacterized protein YggE
MHRAPNRSLTALGPACLLAALALLGPGLVPTTLAARAQPAPGAEPGIVAVGFGQAEAPADSASLQFLVGPSQMAMMSGPMTSVTVDQLDPIVQALVDAGAAEEAIAVTVPATAGAFLYGPGGPESGEIRVDVEEPEPGQLVELVGAAREAASQAGLGVYHVGATFAVDDCAALVQEAREAAIADARSRAEGLAEGLGAALGDLVQASETPYFGPTGGGDCAAGVPPDAAGYGPYGPGTDLQFDPAAGAVAVAYVQVTLTFALGPAGEATPTA